MKYAKTYCNCTIRYERSEENGRLKMNRSIHEVDITEYSTGSKPEDVVSSTQEELEYRNGKLEYSAGNMVVQVVEDSEDYLNKEEQEGRPSFSKIVSARGRYSLTLHECHEETTTSSSVHKKRVQSNMKHSVVEELKAKIDASKFVRT